MRIVNGWVRYEVAELCGARHLWGMKVESREGMPCLCGQMHWLHGMALPVWRGSLDSPSIVHRFGVMRHFIEGECECHPPVASCALPLPISGQP